MHFPARYMFCFTEKYLSTYYVVNYVYLLKPASLTLLGQCLSQLPDKELDTLLSGDCTDAGSLVRGVHVRSFLVANGSQPVALLNSAVDATFDIEWYGNIFI